MAYNNPVFNEKTLRSVGDERSTEGVMTVTGAVNKTGILVCLLVASGAVAWSMEGSPLQMAGCIGAFVLTLVLAITLMFKREWAPTIAPMYAIVEGFLVGSITAMYDAVKPGIASNAMILTFVILMVMLGAYRFKIIQVTEKMRSVVMAATAAIAITYFVDIILSMFSHSVPLIHSTGPYGILFSVIIVGVAAFNLLMDFDMIERMAANRAPKYMEWYAGFALLVTIVWLYLEVLRLLSKLNSRK